MRYCFAGLLLAASLAAHAAVREEPVTYKDGDTTMKGFIVYDDATKARRPGVIVVHEWWGITQHVRDEARKLAAQGYTAFVADMYGDGKTVDTPKEAGPLSGSVRKNPAVMQSRFNAAKEALAKHATVDAKRLGAIGFCFGGSVVLDMARSGADPGDVERNAESVLGADVDLVDADVVIRSDGELVTARITARAPGLIRGTTADVDIVAAVPVEGFRP